MCYTTTRMKPTLLIHKIVTILFFTIVFSLSGGQSALSLTPTQTSDQAHVVTEDIEFSCSQTTDNTAISCAYRLVEPDLTNRISASLGDTELPIRDINTYPFETSTTSILFLMDTSASENGNVLSAMKDHVTAFAQQALPHQSIGLATYDSTLDVIHGIGTDPEDIIHSIAGISETDQPTELYRNTLDALNLLVSTQADRKALFLFSTGESQDQAIYHSDVIKAANAANIKINTIAYPANADTASQHLKELAKDTAGLYLRTSHDGFELPESILLDPYAVIDNGGVLTIDLSPALATELQGLQIAMLVFETTSKRITVKLPLELSTLDNSTQAQFKKADLASSQKLKTEDQSKTPVGATQPSPGSVNQLSSILDQYWLILPAAFLFFAAAGLFYMFIKRGKTTATDEKEDEGPIGYLILLSDDSIKYAINSSPWKIGRTRQNDIFLEHSSVSREHAEFKRNRDGSYTIVDLDSLNGVYLNNNKISTGLVMDGDHIDVGDIKLKFVTQLD